MALEGGLRKDYQVPLILFCYKMMIPAPACSLHQAPWTDPKAFKWCTVAPGLSWAFLLPSLSSVCLILTWS